MQHTRNGIASLGILAALSGAAHGAQHAPGTVIREQKISEMEGDLNPNPNNPPLLQDGGWFGNAAGHIGDLDHDGCQEVAVGAPGAQNGQGEIWLLSLNPDCTVYRAMKIADGAGGLPPGSLTGAVRFGSAVASLGDLDNDLLVEVAVGSIGGRDVLVLSLNTDGTVHHFLEQSGAGGDQYGAALAKVGDLDGDGVTELAVGAPDDNTGGGASMGSVTILFLNADGSVRHFQKVTNGLGGLPAGSLDAGDKFGWSLAGLGDLDENGYEDIAVGAIGDDDGGPTVAPSGCFSCEAMGACAPPPRSAPSPGVSAGRSSTETSSAAVWEPSGTLRATGSRIWLWAPSTMTTAGAAPMRTGARLDAVPVASRHGPWPSEGEQRPGRTRRPPGRRGPLRQGDHRAGRRGFGRLRRGRRGCGVG